MQNLWLVLRMSAPEPSTANQAPRAAQPRAARGILRGVGEAFPGDIGGDLPVLQSLAREQHIKDCFTTYEAACEEATKRAAASPQVPFAVLEIKTIFETTTPKVLVKEFNPAGELVLRAEDSINPPLPQAV